MVLVVKYPHKAINAFSIAQVSSSIIYCISHYGFFYWYIRRLNDYQKHRKGPSEFKSIFSDMQDFPFTSIFDFLPGFMDNKVI